jgi:S1-C subfamily serine protease
VKVAFTSVLMSSFLRLRHSETRCLRAVSLTALFLLCTLSVGAGVPSLGTPPPSGQAFLRRMQSAVVRLRRQGSQGSGVVVTIPPCGTFILTAAHVVAFGVGSIVLDYGSTNSSRWEVTRVFLPLAPEFDISLLTAPRELHIFALPLASESASSLQAYSLVPKTRGFTIGYPVRSVAQRILFGDASQRLVTPLYGGYDLPLQLKLNQGMSGGLLAHEGVQAVQGILALHGDPAWSEDLTYTDGSKVPELLQNDYERLSFAISASRIIHQVRPLLLKHASCNHDASNSKL